MTDTGSPRRTLLLLVGPKGSGKTRLAGMLAEAFGAEAIPVEAMWIARGRDAPRPADPEAGRDWERGGFEAVAGRALAALAQHPLVVLDTTGASEHTPAFVARLETSDALVMVRVTASLDRCAARIAARDASQHLPFDLARLGEIHAASERAPLRFAATYDNDAPWDEPRARAFFGEVLARARLLREEPVEEQ